MTREPNDDSTIEGMSQTGGGILGGDPAPIIVPTGKPRGEGWPQPAESASVKPDEDE